MRRGGKRVRSGDACQQDQAQGNRGAEHWGLDSTVADRITWAQCTAIGVGMNSNTKQIRVVTAKTLRLGLNVPASNGGWS